MRFLEKHHIHYAWVIMISCFMVYGATMGMVFNLGGIFNAAISVDMGITISEFTVVTIASGLTSAVALLTVVDRVIKKAGLIRVMTVSVVVYGVSVVLRSVCTTLWQFALTYALNGLAGAFLLYVPMPLIINAWFQEKAGLALGITMLSSGAVGGIMNPVIQNVILAHGWRYAAVVNGVLSVVMALPFLLIFLKRDPKEMGLLPYGYKGEPEPEKPVTSPSEAARLTPFDTRYSPKEKKKLFAMSFVMAIILYLVSSVPQQLAHFGIVNGLGASGGALLVSCGMAGNMTGKAVMGLCTDRFGKKKTFLAFITISNIGLLMISFLYRMPFFVPAVSAFLIGFTAAENTMIVPMAVGEYSSGEEYLENISRVSVATMLSTAFGTYVSSAIYDLTGSYSIEFMLYLALHLFAMTLLLRILRK